MVFRVRSGLVHSWFHLVDTMGLCIFTIVLARSRLCECTCLEKGLCHIGFLVGSLSFMYNGPQESLWYRKGLIKGPVQHSSHARGTFEGSVFLCHQTFEEGI